MKSVREGSIRNMPEKQAADFGAQPAALADLIDYQQAAVVSRTLVKKKTGTATLFAFDEGEGLSEHTTPYDALVYLVEGEAEIMISGESSRLKSGDIILMPAHQPHAVKAVKRFKMLLIMIRS